MRYEKIDDLPVQCQLHLPEPALHVYKDAWNRAWETTADAIARLQWRRPSFPTRGSRRLCKREAPAREDGAGTEREDRRFFRIASSVVVLMPEVRNRFFVHRPSHR